MRKVSSRQHSNLRSACRSARLGVLRTSGDGSFLARSTTRAAAGRNRRLAATRIDTRAGSRDRTTASPKRHRFQGGTGSGLPEPPALARSGSADPAHEAMVPSCRRAGVDDVVVGALPVCGRRRGRVLQYADRDGLVRQAIDQDETAKLVTLGKVSDPGDRGTRSAHETATWYPHGGVASPDGQDRQS